MDTAKLEELHDLVIGLRERKAPLNMAVWDDGHCRCLAGYAGYHPPFRKLGLRTFGAADGVGLIGNIWYAPEITQTYYAFDALCRFFDLTMEQADYLFSDNDALPPFDPPKTWNDILNRIEDLLEGRM